MSARGHYRGLALLIVPGIALYLVLQVWPIVEAVRLSFTDYNLVRGDGQWVGARNYTDAFSDPVFGAAVWNSLLFFALKVPAQMVLGLALALLVRHPWRGVGIVRAGILVPTVTSVVVVAAVWGLMYDAQNGLFNGLLRTLDLPAQPFLTDAGQALPAIAAMMIWKDVGFTMLFFLAGLMAINPEYYEAARVDGAGRWQTIRHITLPLLRRTTLFVLVLETVSAFKVLAPVLLLTNGGPQDSTRVVVQYIFDNAFRFDQMGYAAALAVLLGLGLATVAALQFRTGRERHA